MCGISGLLDLSRSTPVDRLVELADAMTQPLKHRGPDGAGVWTDERSGVALGHRRLSVQDLSSHGAQPMPSPSGRFTVTYNGELYNAPDLKAELYQRGFRFRGHCDTEVLITAIEAWGLDLALRRLDGMFAFAVWDAERCELHLARDRLGEKPLYYGWAARTFVFGSELKALMAHPDFSREVDRDALALYLRHGCVPAPHSIFVDARKLAPGSTVTVRADTTPRSFPEPRQYWSLRLVALEGMSTQVSSSNGDDVDELDELIGNSVARRLQADVPVGAFLSGGLDSSVVTSLMCQRSRAPVRTFTIGFAESAYDESEDARLIARHLGTDHTAMQVTAADALAAIPQLPSIYDEPFADSSQIPTYLVSQLTRQHVTVSLSGDGGDEFFGGYNRHSWFPQLWRLVAPVPMRVRSAVGVSASRIRPDAWDAGFARLSKHLPPSLRVRTPATKLQKLAAVLAEPDLDAMFLRVVSQWDDPGTVVLHGREPPTVLTEPDTWPALPTPAERFMYLDAVTYLPDDILTKVDRATMRVGLEARVPFLDERVVKFSMRLPVERKISGRTGKVILRDLLARYVPPELTNRPKMGFALPVGDWLRGPLRDWAESLIAPSRLASDGYLAPQPVRDAWSAHRQGRRDREGELWPVLMFQAWLDTWATRGS